MGFFSFRCVECGLPALSPYVLNPTNNWLGHIVVHFKGRRKPLEGVYDGYGRFTTGVGNDFDDEAERNTLGYDKKFTLRHHACWERAGRPGYTGESDPAHDQGWFFPDGKYDFPIERAGQPLCEEAAEREIRLNEAEWEKEEAERHGCV